MKKFFCIAALCTISIMTGQANRSEAQDAAGYTFIRGPMGPQVCVGMYTPPTADSVSGFCDGQVLDLMQFNAASTKLSADRLDQAVQVLVDIDNRLVQSNDKMDRLLEASVSARASSEKQGRDLAEMSDAIERRFQTVPEELLANDSFKQELARLKEDILREVESRYQPRPQAPAVKTQPAK